MRRSEGVAWTRRSDRPGDHGWSHYDPSMLRGCFALGLIVLIQSLAAQETDLRGFYKNFATVNSDEQWEDVQRVRLKLDTEVNNQWDFEAHYEIRATWRDFTPPPNPFVVPHRFFDLEDRFVNEDHLELSHQVDRLRIRYQNESHEIRAGRQAVSWGSGLIWNPTDLFAGFSPLEIDRDDKPGVDVLRWTWTLAGDTSLDLIYEPRDFEHAWESDRDDSALAGRAFGRLGEYDLALMGGYVASDWVVGGDFTGYLLNAGLRGEFSQTFVDESEEPDFFRGLVGLDFSFPVRFDPYLSLEYFYNGFGSDEPADYLERLDRLSVQRAFQRGNAFNVGRQYIGLVKRLTLTALTSVSASTLVNLDDQSVRSLASWNWSARENLDVLLGINAGWGSSGDEFSAGEDYAFGFVKFYF